MVGAAGFQLGQVRSEVGSFDGTFQCPSPGHGRHQPGVFIRGAIVRQVSVGNAGQGCETLGHAGEQKGSYQGHVGAFQYEFWYLLALVTLEK